MDRNGVCFATSHNRTETRRHLSRAVHLCAVLLAFLLCTPAIAEEDAYAASRARMVETIELHARFAASATGRDRLDPRVIEVMGTVPRHAFLPEGMLDWLDKLLAAGDVSLLSYADRPLPIGHGQTMSQPFIVALMTDLLLPEPNHVVLEVGTGSGYQAAVLSHLVKRVCTIEIIPELGASAAAILTRLDYKNVETRVGDGYFGWQDCGPFDGIVVTAAAGHIPPPLLKQLKVGGRMIIPVGGAFSTQQLMMVEKRADGSITTRHLLPVRFVPLVGETP